MERRERIPPAIMETSEFKQAIEVYGKVLGTCKVPPDDVRKQLIGLQESTISRRRAMHFIDLAQKLQVTPLLRSNKI